MDTVSVHGIQDDCGSTCHHRSSAMWLYDILSGNAPFAYIMIYNYDSTVVLSKSVAKVEDIAINLLS